MPDFSLAAPQGYDPNSQAVVGMMAAIFDDQSRRLQGTLAGLEVEHFEWQERPGRNTIGMLVAHLAVGEFGAFQVVVQPGLTPAEYKRVNYGHLGVDIDGIAPLKGTHAASLKGRDLTGYLDLLERARTATHEVLTTWHDPALDTIISVPGMTYSRRWLLYRILDHFAGHVGQIDSLLQRMRDHEVPGLPEKPPFYR